MSKSLFDDFQHDKIVRQSIIKGLNGTLSAHEFAVMPTATEAALATAMIEKDYAQYLGDGRVLKAGGIRRLVHELLGISEHHARTVIEHMKKAGVYSVIGERNGATIIFHGNPGICELLRKAGYPIDPAQPKISKSKPMPPEVLADQLKNLRETIVAQLIDTVIKTCDHDPVLITRVIGGLEKHLGTQSV